MNKYLIFAIFLGSVAQALTFFQGQSQFFWSWAKEHPWAISCAGVPISYMFIKFFKYCALSYDGQIWPGRLVGFALGSIVFTILAWFIMKEPISTKTFVCLLLSAGILGIQILWK